MKKRAKKAGRPPLPSGEKLEKYVTIRFAIDDHKTLQRASKQIGQPSVTVFIRDAALKEARQVLGE